MNRTFGDDALDLRDLHDEFYALGDPTEWDDSEEEFARLFLQLKDELWDDIQSAMRNEPTLILDTHFEEYAENYASEIGAISSDAVWPLDNIDWHEAAEDLKQGFHKVTVGPYVYYRREY